MEANVRPPRRFIHNVDKWAHIEPRTALTLPYIDCSSLLLCSTDQGEPNLQNADEPFFYHAQSGALEESQRALDTLDLNAIDILYVYGVGLGYSYLAARQWLKKKRSRRLVFLEDDPAVIYRLFETAIGSRLLRDSQVWLHSIDPQKVDDSALTKLYWKTRSTRIAVIALPSYAHLKSQRLAELQHQLSYDAALHDAILGEYLSHGAIFFRNFYFNMLQLSHSYLGDALKNRFRGIPAIICGAGPSLTKQLPLLAQLQDKALIFAGGTAVNALNAAGIQPHFAANLDPNPDLLKRLSTHTAFDVPFFYQSRIVRGALQLIQGPHLYVTGSGGYATSKWFEEQLHIHGEEVDEGYNVLAFCLGMARLLGCGPIFCVGIDLAFTDKQLYAKGVFPDAPDSPTTEGLGATPVTKVDIEGKPIQTLWKWVAEAQWIGTFAEKYSEIKLWNCTEGGLGFPGVDNLPFAEAIQRYLTTSYPLKQRIQEEIARCKMPQVTDEAIHHAMDQFSQSLVRCYEYLAVLIEEAQKLQKQITQTEQIEVTQGGRAALAENELTAEPAFCYLLERFYQMYAKILEQERQQLTHSPRIVPWKKAVRHLALNLKQLHFVQDVVKTQIILIREAIKNQ